MPDRIWTGHSKSADSALFAADFPRNGTPAAIECLSSFYHILPIWEDRGHCNAQKVRYNRLTINYLTRLDVSYNTVLTELNCSSNRLSALDVSANSALITLCCSDNQLAILDVSNNSNLQVLYCNANWLSFSTISLPTNHTIESYDYRQYPLPMTKV